ncbi:MAG: hypothetical protein AAB517_01975 [Patescibacteria group bacterium]
MSEGPPVSSEVSPKEVIVAGDWFLGELENIGLHPDEAGLLHERFVGGLELDGVPAWSVKDGVRPMTGANRRLEQIKAKKISNLDSEIA